MALSPETIQKRLDGIAEIIKAEKHKVSYLNGYYDWSLLTSTIKQGQREFTHFVNLAIERKITKDQFLTAIYVYFDIVYAETLRVWNERLVYLRAEYAKNHKELVPYHTIESLHIPTKELDFINERWECWAARDKEFVDDVFDNKVPEPDLSHLEVPDNLIRDINIEMPFGKYGRYGNLGRIRTYLLKEVITTDPQYVLWMHKNTDRFKLCPELLAEAESWSEVIERKR